MKRTENYTLNPTGMKMETTKAWNKIDEMKKHPEKYKSYSDVDKMMEDILSEV